jgi:hypothetical protein
MDRQWQDQLLALVTRYGEACAQLAAERESGRCERPRADRSGAWAAILSHVATARAAPAEAAEGSR